MAKLKTVVFVDDIDGSPADHTVSFTVDGVSYQIDLSDEHAAALHEDFDKWVKKARRVSGRKTTGRRSSSSEDVSAIREWAQANGVDVSARGRISAKVRQAYQDAH
ncbi:MAG: Lsr2 family protein [Propionibacteriaceae bacterium]|jgi:hypothetical protein|nr:Lsr2 family protein [Propionibacteriaceae bacterium]